MMTSGISAGNNWLSQLGQQSNTITTCGSSAAKGGGATSSNDSVGMMPSPGTKLLDAMTSALSQIGVAGASTSSSSTGSDASSTAQDPAQALAAFMQDLMAALQSQGGAQSAGAQGGGDSDGDNDGSGAPAPRAAGRHHHNMQAALRSLIQQLSASSPPGSAATDPALTNLQQGFQSLVGSVGGSASSANLGDFLQAFANNMQAAGAVGNVVKAQA